MEQFKPLLHIGEKTILEHAIELFILSNIDEVFTVVGHRAQELVPVLERLQSQYVINNNYREGMFSSVQVGATALQHICEAFFLLPVDIPLIRPNTVHQLLNAFYDDPSFMVYYPQLQSRRGHPPLVSSRLIEQIIGYKGECGMRGLLRNYQDQAKIIPVDDPFIRMDVDTKEDLRLLREKYRAIQPV